MNPSVLCTAPRRRVHVSVGFDRLELPYGVPPPVTVLGVVAPGAPWYADLWPSARARTTRFRSAERAVEQVCLSGAEDLSALPGLDPRRPSRMRDAVRLALRAGAPMVTVLLVRGEGLPHPWSLDAPELLEATSSFLDDLHGTMLVLPDAGGPATVGPLPAEEPATRLSRLRAVLRAHGPGLAERYQVGLLDWPADAPMEDELIGLEGHDFALCRWVEDPARAGVHGWRCAAAAVAGALATREPHQSLIGLRMPLGPGRPGRPDRDLALGDGIAAAAAQDGALCLRVDPQRDEAVADDEPTLRRPVGAWPLSALRTVKAMHLCIVRAAERFAFERLEPSAAFSLALALDMALRPFVEEGLLVGSDPSQGPAIDGELVRDPAAPSLAATIEGQLRPWCQAVRVRVTVRDGARPTLETR